MKRIIGIIMLFSLVTSCGTIFNKKKPPLRYPQAIENAYYYRVIEPNVSYSLGNFVMMLFFPIGTVIGGLGIMIDKGNGAYWQIKDQRLYNKWQEKYEAELKAQREELLK